MDELIAEVKAEYADSEGWPKTTPLPREKALAWMQSKDLEVLGAVHRLLRYKGGMERIQPPLSFEESFKFMTGYYRRCLCEYSAEAWDTWQEADIGIDAAHAVVWWFLDLWADRSVPRSELKKVKHWLEDLLRTEPQARELMGAPLFDHLFRKHNIIKFFADWREDPLLRPFLPTPTKSS
jgi:hypothetical protein